MPKYFSYDAIDATLLFHASEEEAKKSAIDIAEDGYHSGTDWDGSFPDDQQDIIKDICYGVILGQVDLPCRPTSVEEDGEEAAEEFKYVVEPPVIIEYAKNNGWIKCEDRLPPVGEDGKSYPVLLYGVEAVHNQSNYVFIGYLSDGDFYSDREYGPLRCHCVTHWQPLPPEPEN